MYLPSHYPMNCWLPIFWLRHSMMQGIHSSPAVISNRLSGDYYLFDDLQYQRDFLTANYFRTSLMLKTWMTLKLPSQFLLTKFKCVLFSNSPSQFLTFVRGLDVDLKKESQDLIRSYYIASRTSRCFIDSSFLMPRTSIKTMLAIIDNCSAALQDSFDISRTSERAWPNHLPSWTWGRRSWRVMPSLQFISMKRCFFTGQVWLLWTLMNIIIWNAITRFKIFRNLFFAKVSRSSE